MMSPFRFCDEKEDYQPWPCAGMAKLPIRLDEGGGE
jgi:hypothetical protein